MAITTICQKLGYGTPVSQHSPAGWTLVSQHTTGLVVTQQADGSGGRTQVTAH